MNSPIVFSCILAMLLSLLMFFFDRGYKKANRFLSATIFFSALYELSFYINNFSHSLHWGAIFITGVPSCIFLIGPFSYLYVRSILRDNTKFSNTDYLHFAFFFVCFSGTLPFLFSSWAYKLEVANYYQNISHDVRKYRLNIFFPTFFNQGVRPFHLAFYFMAQWGLIWKHFRNSTNNSSHWLIIKKWLIIYSTLITLIDFGYSVSTIVYLLWPFSALNHDVTISTYYLCFAGYGILIATLLLFPQILYGLPIGLVNYTPINNAEIGEKAQKIDASKPELSTFAPSLPSSADNMQDKTLKIDTSIPVEIESNTSSTISPYIDVHKKPLQFSEDTDVFSVPNQSEQENMFLKIDASIQAESEPASSQPTSPDIYLSESSLLISKKDLTASIPLKQQYSNEYIQEIEQKLEDYLAEKKHLDPDCSLTSLSEDTKISVHHLSYYFNAIKLTSFPDWRNNHRIDYSITLIDSGEMENMTLNAIAQQAGFATQKTFIKAFKLKMGTTPAEFIKSRKVYY